MKVVEHEIKEEKKKVKLKNIEDQNQVIASNKKNKISRIFKKILEILKNNLIFFIGVILLVIKGLFLNYLLGLEIKSDVILYTIAASLFIMCPTINHKDKFGYFYFNMIYAVVTIILYANFLYYSYSTNFLSFYQIENMKYAKEIGSGLLCIITIKSVLLFWMDNIIIVLLSLIVYKKLHKPNSPRRLRVIYGFSSAKAQKNIYHAAVATLKNQLLPYDKKTFYRNKILKIALILAILLLNVIIITNKINDIYTSKGYNKSLIVQEVSIYYYHYKDAKDYFSSMFVKEKIDEEKLKNAYEENLNGKEKETEYTGIAKDCNVIILQLESLNEYVIGKKVNEKEITPNLNQFFSSNIYCSDMYNQGLGTTADSEFEMENSMYPLENGYVFQKYYANNWLDIYTTLRNNGYYTSFMHPNTSTFWNREEVYNIGYHIDEYNDINRFPNIETAGEFYSDEGFFEEAVNIMNSYEGKFCTTLVSVTTHIPFHLTGVSNLEEKLTITQEDVKQYEDETFQNYLISCNFVDYAFGKLIQNLEETRLLEKSIFVVYGDHGAGLVSIEDIQKLYEENNIEYTDFEDSIKETHIPFGIKIPTLDKVDTIERAVAKIDIKPTILDLLGVENNFSIGNSIFSDKDYSFIKGLGYVTSKNYCINDKYYDRQTFEEIEENGELKSLLQKMENEIYLSDTIIKNNLLN